MSITLLRHTVRKNLTLFVIFLAIMIFYSAVMISMFSPSSIESLNAMFEVFPPDMMKAFGFSGVFTNFLGYLASWLYGFILTAFPMVYSIILGNRLVAKTVESGSMACLLATPNSRTKIIATKGVYAIVSVALLHFLLFGVNLAISKAAFPAETLDTVLFAKLNVTIALVNMTSMAIAFFCSCLFNSTKLSLGVGAGIPIASLAFNMLGSASEKSEVLKDISFYGWYDPVGIVNGDATLTVNLIYGAIIMLLFVAGILVFRKKRLPI